MKKFAVNDGFTLIELMITLVVVIILVAVAAPSFNALIQDNRAATQANNLLASLQIARSEAITRGVQVTMRRLSGTNSVWEDGWQIFTDWNGDGQIPAANLNLKDCSVEGQDCLLMEQQSLGNNITLRTGGNYTSWLGFLPSGEPVSSGFPNGTFTLSLSGTGNRCIIINRMGRPRIETKNEGEACSP